MKPLLKFLETLVFPYICVVCKNNTDTDKELCITCSRLLPWIEDRCFRCGRRTHDRALSVHCEKCWENPPAYDRLFTLFDYEPPVSSLIASFKFNRKLSIGKLFGELLSEKVSTWYKKELLPEVLIPVPLHAKRLRKRGFNQSFELLRPSRQLLQIPVLDRACVRTRSTRPQAGLKGEHRRSNVRNAFKVLKPLPYEHVAILDDVVTTGSTVNALARALKQSGVEWIDVWCICKV